MPSPYMTVMKDAFKRIAEVMDCGRFTKEELQHVRKFAEVVIAATDKALARGPGKKGPKPEGPPNRIIKEGRPPCTVCDGTGKIKYGDQPTYNDCLHCSGKGYL